MTSLLKKLRLHFLRRHIRSLEEERASLLADSELDPGLWFQLGYLAVFARTDRLLKDFRAKARSLEKQQ